MSGRGQCEQGIKANVGFRYASALHLRLRFIALLLITVNAMLPRTLYLSLLPDIVIITIKLAGMYQMKYASCGRQVATETKQMTVCQLHEKIFELHTVTKVRHGS